MRGLSGARIAVATLIVALAAAGYFGAELAAKYSYNEACCGMPAQRNLLVSAREALNLVQFFSQSGQDKWVSEVVFPDVTNGFFLDVGSADGTTHSNSKALEKKGWTGICVDAFPRNMHDRTCRVFKEAVFSETGRKVRFHTAGDLGGIAETLGAFKGPVQKAPAVEFTTVTLGDILERAKAPPFIHFMSLDIEGAELEALKGFPFEKVRIGAIVVEHNDEQAKRAGVRALLEGRGYRFVRAWLQDDYYVPAAP